MRVVLHREEWMEQASCQYVDPELFYQDDGQLSQRKAEAAVKVCRHCPVIMDCLRWAFRTDDQFGVLGGMTPRERRRLKEKLRWQRAEVQKVS
jgi:WhiB family redox-sensing transcriptional regulator